jgi:signal transduction histidine kinase
MGTPLATWPQLSTATPHLPALEVLFAALIHELRTPLSIITGFTELMEDGAGGEPSHQHRLYLGQIRERAEDIELLVNDMLDFVKLRQGAMVLDTLPVSARETLEMVAASFGPIALKRQISIEVRCQRGLPSVQADPARLRQILNNLISNALKFTPEHGLITLRAHLSGEMVAISVVDTGIGIPPASLPHLFESFYQVKPACGGTGLGLMIAKQLVMAHGGTIAVQSEPGEGSTFTVTIPRAHSRESARRA